MRKTALRALAIAIALTPAVVFSQGGKTKPTKATYITKEEVDSFRARCEAAAKGGAHAGQRAEGMADTAEGRSHSSDR